MSSMAVGGRWRAGSPQRPLFAGGGGAGAPGARRWVKGCRGRRRVNGGFGGVVCAWWWGAHTHTHPRPALAAELIRLLRGLSAAGESGRLGRCVPGGAERGAGLCLVGAVPAPRSGGGGEGVRGPRCGWAWGRCHSVGRGAVPPARAHANSAGGFFLRERSGGGARGGSSTLSFGRGCRGTKASCKEGGKSPRLVPRCRQGARSQQRLHFPGCPMRGWRMCRQLLPPPPPPATPLASGLNRCCGSCWGRALA